MHCLKFFNLANVDFVQEWKGHWGYYLTQHDDILALECSMRFPSTDFDTSYSEFWQIAYRRLLYYQSSLYFASCIPVIVQGYEYSNMRGRQSLCRTYIGRNPAPPGPFIEIDRIDVLEWNYHIISWFTMSLRTLRGEWIIGRISRLGHCIGVYVILV